MITSIVKMLLKHPYQAINNMDGAQISAPFRGRPELSSKDLDQNALNEMIEMCPTRALSAAPFSLDMGKCIFCGECAHRMPKNIKFTQSWRLWAFEREGLVVKADETLQKLTVDEKLRKPLFRKALRLREVCAGSDGTIEMELNASDNVNFDMRHYGISFTASPRHADGMVITGPITRGMADAVRITYDTIPAPKLLILVGADAISGGMFEGGEAIDRSFLEGRKVDLYVAGHPTHPLAFVGGVRDLVGNFKFL